MRWRRSITGAPADNRAWLNETRLTVKAKVRNRAGDSNRWKAVSTVLVFLGVGLGGLGGITVFTDLATTSVTARVILGVLTLAAGVCSAVLPKLKAEQRYFANLTQLNEWKRLLTDIDAAAANWDQIAPASQANVVSELNDRCRAQESSDLKDRKSAASRADQQADGQRPMPDPAHIGPSSGDGARDTVSPRAPHQA